jgi:hypothetical protein
MSTQILSLFLPSVFTVPKDLKTTTPDENAFIITAGFHAFQSYNKDKASHCDKSLQEHLDAYKAQLDEAHLQLEERLKKQHAAELAAAKSAQTSAESAYAAQKAALEKQIASAQATAESARAAQAATTANAAQAEADARKRAQDGAAEQIRHLEQERERVAAELKTQRETAVAEREKLRVAEREASEKLRIAEREASEKLRAAEREMREKLLTAEREANERLATQAAEAQKREDDLYAKLGIKSNSSRKGASFEDVMTELLTRAFGGDFLEKQLNAGDHVMLWEGYKLLIEDKAGHEKGLPKKEIEKAHGDFVRHRDCDLMMLICADGVIPGHTKHTNFDVGVYDGRPVIYVGKLNDKEDKEEYMKMLQPVIRELIKLTKKAAASGIDIKEELENKISKMTQTLKRYEQKMSKARNSAHRMFRTITAAMDEHREEMKDLSADFEADIVAEAEEALLPILPPKPAEPKKEPKCGACKQTGHMKSQKSKCPLKGVAE